MGEPTPALSLDAVIAALTSAAPAKRAEMAKHAREVVVSLGNSGAWTPNPGPQTDAYLSKADVLLYGGQGGGGKSDLGLGLAFTAHHRSLIMRRQYADLGGMTDRAIEINGTRQGFNGSPPPKLLTGDKRLIRFGANQYAGDEEHWQGQPFDLKVFDEAVQFLESQVRYHLGWVRSVRLHQRSRAILPSNPPIQAQGQWIVPMFAPWLDITYGNPAQHGELRWVVTDPDGKDFWVDGPEPYLFPGQEKPNKPLSRTFIPAELRDNPYLVNTNYQAQLDSLQEPLRSAIRDGNFMAAKVDGAFQVIPTGWVIAAQKRWSPKPPMDVPMCAMAVDASGGGHDPMIISSRYDGWFSPLIEVAGKDIPADRAGAYSAGVVISHRKDDAEVTVDMGGGYGGPLFETLKAVPVVTHGYKGAEAGTGRTRDRQMTFYNRRSETIWRFREALDPEQPGGSPIMLPPDPAMVADLTAPTWEPVRQGGAMAVKVESKEDVCARLGRSTDRGDAVQMCWQHGLKTSHVRGGFGAGGFGKRKRPEVIMGHANVRRRGGGGGGGGGQGPQGSGGQGRNREHG